MNFHKRLKELRKEKGITQEQLGKILNYGRTAIAGYETGRNEPSYNILQKLSEYFEVSISYLIGSSNLRNEKPPSSGEEIRKKLSSSIYNLLIQKGVIIENQDLTEDKKKEIEALFAAAIDIYNLKHPK